MRKVINGKVYDTETADLVHEWSNGRFMSDFRHRSKNLYRTKKGSWFIHHKGGPMTDMAISIGSNGSGGSENIEPILEETAIKFLESHDGDEVILKIFPEKVEEA